MTRLVFTAAGGFIALIGSGRNETGPPGRLSATPSTPHLAS